LFIPIIVKVKAKMPLKENTTKGNGKGNGKAKAKAKVKVKAKAKVKTKAMAKTKKRRPYTPAERVELVSVQVRDFNRNIESEGRVPVKCQFIFECGKKEGTVCLKPCSGLYCKRHKPYKPRTPDKSRFYDLKPKIPPNKVVTFFKIKEYENDMMICKLKRELAEAQDEISSLKTENGLLRSKRDGNHCKQRDKRMSRMQLCRKRLKSRSLSTKGTADS
jgi:hypothetical protein